MKKLMILALGVILVAAYAVPAMAETQVDFSGSYRVQAYYNTNMNLADDSEDEFKTSYFRHRFRAAFNIMPNDNITLVLKMQANKDQKWGEAASGQNGVANLYVAPGDVYANADNDFDIYQIYMDIRTPYGMFSFGRMPGGFTGLQLLGYTGSSYWGCSLPFDAEDYWTAVKYTYASGPLTVVAKWTKVTEYDNTSGDLGNPGVLTQAITGGGNQYDQDRDTYTILPIYRFPNGGVTLNLSYAVDKTGQAFGAVGVNGADADGYVWLIEPAIAYQFGPVGLYGELQYRTGKVTFSDAWQSLFPAGTVGPPAEDVDLSGLGFYLAGVYNYGMGEVGLEYLWTQGDDGTEADRNMAAVNSGGDFTPMFIMNNGWTGLQTALPAGSTGSAAMTGGLAGTANHWYLGAWVDHNVTEDLMLHAALGYAQINETRPFETRAANGTFVAGWEEVSRDYGWEIDLGVSYAIMSNLTYTLDFGYFTPGDFHKYGQINHPGLGSTWSAVQTLSLGF